MSLYASPDRPGRSASGFNIRRFPFYLSISIFTLTIYALFWIFGDLSYSFEYTNPSEYSQEYIFTIVLRLAAGLIIIFVLLGALDFRVVPIALGLLPIIDSVFMLLGYEWYSISLYTQPLGFLSNITREYVGVEDAGIWFIFNIGAGLLISSLAFIRNKHTVSD